MCGQNVYWNCESIMSEHICTREYWRYQNGVVLSWFVCLFLTKSKVFFVSRYWNQDMATASFRWILQLHKDVPKAARFYAQGLDFSVNVVTLRWAELQSGPLKLALMQSPRYWSMQITCSIICLTETFFSWVCFSRVVFLIWLPSIHCKACLTKRLMI